MKVETLNLHGMALDDALEKTKFNLRWCLEHGVEVLDINHGKGLHSGRNFSVIKKEIRRWLKNESLLTEFGYIVVYGESNLPVALSYDDGHTLVVARGKEHDHIGGRKQQARNEILFSPEGKKERRMQKKNRRK
ncbi:MAG: Smr/MutS family protein [Deltaproteobacteria bacterium]